MSRPIAPMDLFREFSAEEESARQSDNFPRAQAYATIVDLVDGLTKGLTGDKWQAVYTRLYEIAKENRLHFVIMGVMDDEECLAWNEIMGTMQDALDTF